MTWRPGLWTACGATAGGGVTAGFWFGAPGGLAALSIGLGTCLGAVLGRLAGDGSVKREWAGAVGATVVPALTLALANVVALFVITGNGD